MNPDDEHRQQAAFPWAVSFSYGSPAMMQQYRFGQLAVPKELLHVNQLGEASPLPRKVIEQRLADDGNKGAALRSRWADANRALAEAKGKQGNAAEVKRLERKETAAKRELRDYEDTLGLVDFQTRTFGVTPDQLLALTDQHRSKPVHPAQLYATINALLLAWLLSRIYWIRRRHGVLVGIFLMVYPVSRFLLELIRQDNPLDSAGLTISQFLGLGLILVGAVFLWYNSRLPVKCPLAVPYEPPEADDPPPRAKKKK